MGTPTRFLRGISFESSAISGEVPTMALYLVPKRDGRPIVIDKAVLFVGRHPDCDVILTKSRKVSRKHCCLAQVDNQFYLRDLGSMNGVSVNGERVHGCTPVGVGDEIVIGDVPFELKADERSRASKPPRPVPTPPEPVSSVQTLDGPEDISQNFPVPIADEADVSFEVQGTERSLPRVETIDDSNDDVIPIDPPAHGPLTYDDDDGSLDM